MPIIQKLPKILADQIAAGEVVDGPASVVKELVENAIDAGATEIVIRLKDGGKAEIQVTDNGCGIGKEDLLLAIERHATSKIETFADLLALKTHGFRGEALASIAAVSRMRIVSAIGIDPSADAAWQLDVDPLESPKLSSVLHPRGTSVGVYHLFSWVPARKKYLGSARAELSRCHRTLWPLLLMHPHIVFEIFDDDSTHKPVRYPASSSSEDRFFHLFPMHLRAEVFRIFWEHQEHRCQGFLSNPMATMSGHRHLFIAVNHRIVAVPAILALLRNMFLSIDGKRGYPWGFLHIGVSKSEVDFNVDPKKETVRIARLEDLLENLKSHLKDVVHRGAMIAPSAVRWDGRIDKGVTHNNDVALGFARNDVARQAISQEDFFRPSTFLHQDQVNWTQLVFVGIIEDVIICAHDETDVIFLDQHALHERIVFAKYMDAYGRGPVPMQQMLIPESQEVDQATYHILQERESMLQKMGFSIGFQDVTVFLYAYPACFDMSLSLSSLLSWIERYRSHVSNLVEESIRNLVADMACKRSIRRGDKLGAEEVRALFLQAQNWIGQTTIACQHGRPFVVKYPLRDLYGTFYRTR